MANSSVPTGFQPVRPSGAPLSDDLERVYIDSSNAHPIFRGDLVMRSSGSNRIDATMGSTGPNQAGVFWGCKYFNTQVGRTVWSPYYPGSVGSNAANGVTEAYIISNPEMLFTAAAGSSTALATMTGGGDVGYAATIVTSQSSFGNTATGISAMMLSTAYAAIGAGSSYPWVIVDLLSNYTVAGTPGTEASAGNLVVVRPNAWARHAGVVTQISTS